MKVHDSKQGMLACVDSKFTPIFQKKKEQYTPVHILNAEDLKTPLKEKKKKNQFETIEIDKSVIDSMKNLICLLLMIIDIVQKQKKTFKSIQTQTDRQLKIGETKKAVNWMILEKESIKSRINEEFDIFSENDSFEDQMHKISALLKYYDEILEKKKSK